MERKINLGIVGYGNLGKGAVEAIKNAPDMNLVGIFSRRDPKTLGINEPGIIIDHVSNARKYAGQIDVMLLCGGSATDLPVQTPEFTEYFNTIDSFDTHAKIPEHYEKVHEVALKNKKVAIISVGWDPGLFSINRVMADAIMPKGKTYTFWGEGLSQGHSDAVRRVAGVKYGVQYTIPNEKAIEQVRRGENPELTTAEKHRRVCYVVPEEGADLRAIERTIKTMPNYFADYHTEVNFITEEEFMRDHTKSPHGGFVIHSGTTGQNEHKQVYEFSLKLESNPEFTASVLVAYARAAFRLSNERQYGCKTVFDIPPGYLSPYTPEELREKFL